MGYRARVTEGRAASGGEAPVFTPRLHAVMMLVAIGLAVAWGDLWVLAGLGVASLAGWARWHRRPWRLGPADRITALRVWLIACLALLGPERLVPAGGVLVLVVFVLDGLDGWWARKTGTATAFGAAFDQEADAFLVAMVSTALVLGGLAPGWVLLTGVLRYGYVLVVQALRLRGEAPRSTIARYVFAGVVLAMAASLSWPSPTTRALVAVASALLVWSFGRSLWWSWRGPVAGHGQ